MKTSSAKAKGRRAAALLREKLLAAAPELQPDDIIVTSSGVKGEDLLLSPKARTYFPFQFEVKNVEKLNIWEAYKQATTHGDYTPFLAFKRNHSNMMVCMELDDFLELYTNKCD